jgi:hypothetical protein
VQYQEVQYQVQYRILDNLNLYSSPELNSLVTQAAPDRWLTINSQVINPQAINSQNGGERNPEIDSTLLPMAPPIAPLTVKLAEDQYPGWLDPADWGKLVASETQYCAPVVTELEIKTLLPDAIVFARQAMTVNNRYLWGGTVAPNYDCSGLMQAAFRSVGIQLPRDAYQQESFLTAIPWPDLSQLLDQLQPGDLIFFGIPIKATHVGLYLGNGEYVHSSGIQHGRNGIGIDSLDSSSDDPVSRHYLSELRGAGRVVKSFSPEDL